MYDFIHNSKNWKKMNKVNLSTKKETKVRMKINEIETKKQWKRLMKLRAYSNKTGKPLARFNKKKEYQNT